MLKLKNLAPNQTELELDNMLILFSYKTPVAAWVSGRGWLRTDTKYSKTTTKHINQWLDAAGTVVPQSEIDNLVKVI